MYTNFELIPPPAGRGALQRGAGGRKERLVETESRMPWFRRRAVDSGQEGTKPPKERARIVHDRQSATAYPAPPI